MADADDSRWLKRFTGALVVLLLAAALAREALPKVALDRYVAGDHATATLLWKGLCHLRVAESCYFLGIQYKDGDTVPVDVDRAASLYAYACNENIYGACTNLGQLHD